MQMTSPNIEIHVGVMVASANHPVPNEVAPAANCPIPYPEWSQVIDSLLDAFARLHAAGPPAQGASAPIAPADGRPPDPATLTDEEAFLICIACYERPGLSRMDDSFNGILEAAMTLHLRAALRHNRQMRPDGLSQSSEGGQAV